MDHILRDGKGRVPHHRVGIITALNPFPSTHHLTASTACGTSQSKGIEANAYMTFVDHLSKVLLASDYAP